MVARCVISALIALCVVCAGQKTTQQSKRNPQDHITFSGGSGDSHEDAIVINGVEKQSDGVEAEYRYLSKVHGVKDKEWKVTGQTMYREEKKVYDVVEIVLIPSGSKRIYYFDVSGFPWKRKGLQ